MLAAAMMIGFASADPIKDPARMRINSNILTTVFHKGDQRILDVFDNLSVGRVDSTDEPGYPDFALDDMVVSLKTAEGIDTEEYDFKISLNDEALGFLGFQGDNLRVLGSASYDGVSFNFEAPVSAMRLVVELVEDEDEDAK